MSHLTVTGARPPKPEIPDVEPVTPVRLNITELMKDDKQWSLYIQALSLLQKDAPEGPLSWFSVGAIHGFPVDWQWENAGDKNEMYGYCVHGDPHFPTWHRPYVALYEQAIQDAALRVAEKYTEDSDAWMQAALALRAPYWDWADPKTYLPPRQVYDSTRFATLNVTTPDGPASVPNPLLSYRFQQKMDWDFSQYQTTVRHPRRTASASIEAFEDDVGGQAEQGNWKFECWRTLSRTNTWLQFSNVGLTQGQRANSLESIHGSMHVRVGGGGHMSDPISAAFDPIFMLHHVNVDRQLALWQALHPDVWISEEHEPEYVNRDLLPFWKDDTEFHRSSSTPVRDFVQFGATYPEFVGLEGVSAEERKTAIQAKVDALYDPDNRRRGIVTRSAAGASRGFLSAAGAALAVSGSPVQSVMRAVGAPTPETQTVALDRYDWFVRIRVNMFQIGQSFTVLLFLDTVPDDVSQWRSSPNFVGSYGAFVNSEAQSCPNCRTNANLVMEGFVQLDDAFERLGYGDKNEDEIEEAIREKLNWRIQKIDGTEVQSEELESLEVAVLTWDVAAGDDVRPVHRDVTSHKSGGRIPKV